MENEKIKNKDIPLLEGLMAIMIEVPLIEQKWLWNQERKYHITQNMSQAPGASNNASKIESILASMDTLDEKHQKRMEEYTGKMEKAQDILNGIKEPIVRTFAVMKYIMNMPETQIRAQLALTEWRYKQLKKAVENAPCMCRVRWKEERTEEKGENFPKPLETSPLT